MCDKPACLRRAGAATVDDAEVEQREHDPEHPRAADYKFDHGCRVVFFRAWLHEHEFR